MNIIELAKEAGFDLSVDEYNGNLEVDCEGVYYTEVLERFAALVLKAEADETRARFAQPERPEALADHIPDATKMVAEHKCNPHPDAPHGFDRNASHSADRYVCECEGWEPPKQEPVAWWDGTKNFVPFSSAPVDAKAIRAEERQRCIEAIRKAHDEELCDAWDCIKVIKELE